MSIPAAATVFPLFPRVTQSGMHLYLRIVFVYLCVGVFLLLYLCTFELLLEHSSSPVCAAAAACAASELSPAPASADEGGLGGEAGIGREAGLRGNRDNSRTGHPAP